MLRFFWRSSWRHINNLTKFALLCALLLLLAGAGVLLTLRYWVLPDIERYHDSIVSVVSDVVGQPVTIGKIQADWRGIRPHLALIDVLILDKQGHTVLALRRVDNVVSWMSALTGGVRLSSLEIDQPDLLIRRDAQGLLHVAGISVLSSVPGQLVNYELANWLISQASIVVRDAHVTWHDEQRAAPPLSLSHANILIENSGHHHRFSLQGQPPAELSAQLDLRGDFVGVSLDSLSSWRGDLYGRLDYADIAAWGAWLPLPITPQSGNGALRAWMSIEDGKPNELTADLVLSGVRARLADNLPPLDLAKLYGRIAWRHVANGFEVSTQKFSLRTNGGIALQPIDLYLRFVGAVDQKPSSGEVRLNMLDMSNLSSLSHFMPVPSSFERQLSELAPQGQVFDLKTKWEGGFDSLLGYNIKARFDKVSIRRTDKFPGFAGLSGQVDGSEVAGTLSLNARNVIADAPLVMPEPLALDSLSGRFDWRRNNRGVEIKFNKVRVANADLEGDCFGSYQDIPQGSGVIDLSVNLARANMRHTDRYIPSAALGIEARSWIRNALIDGQVDDFHLILKGGLNDFPFEGNRSGTFQIRAHANGVAIEYAKGWPRVDSAGVNLLIQGKRLEVTAPTAMTVGAPLKDVSVVLPDIRSPGLPLQIRGESDGETRHALSFIQKSPVHGYLDDVTSSITSSGSGKLNLQMSIPLSGSGSPVVSGRYRFIDNEINLGKGIPILRQVSGDLLFSESFMRTQNVTAKILGGEAALSIKSGKDGAIYAKVSGHASVDTLREVLPHAPLEHLHGSSDWESEITLLKKQTGVVLTSNLVGLSSDLPVPFAKRAEEVVPFRFEVSGANAHQDLVYVQYGTLLGAKFLRWDEGGERIVKRGTIKFGSSGKWLEKDGIWVTGVIPELSLEGWGGLMGSLDDSVLGGVTGADLLIRKIRGYGYTTEGLHVSAHNQKDAMVAQLSAKSTSGEVSWYSEGNGKFVARLKSVSLDPDQDAIGKNKNALARLGHNQKNTTDTKYPALDIVVDSVTLNKKNIGRLELLAQQHENDWLLERLVITNPGSVLTGDGKWRILSGEEQTQVNLKLNINDMGIALGRFGYPGSVKDGAGKLEGVFTWPGAPAEFSYATLDGVIKLSVSQGQFLKIDPGAGKLLSILSLQALPQHIALDFTDIFSAGFKFDSIDGAAKVTKGIMNADNFKIDGSAAKVTMKGQIDLDHETQNLRVRVLPTVGNTASLLSALAGGPLVGAGVFIANKILREPIDKLMSYEYDVTGPWVSPNVEKVGTKKSSPPQ